MLYLKILRPSSPLSTWPPPTSSCWSSSPASQPGWAVFSTLIRPNNDNNSFTETSPLNRFQSDLLCSACPTSDGNTQSGIDLSGLNHPYIAIYLPPCHQQRSNIRINIFCSQGEFGLPNPLCAGDNCHLRSPDDHHPGWDYHRALYDPLGYLFKHHRIEKLSHIWYFRCSSLLHLCLVEKQARDDSAMVK